LLAEVLVAALGDLTAGLAGTVDGIASAFLVKELGFVVENRANGALPEGRAMDDTNDCWVYKSVG